MELMDYNKIKSEALALGACDLITGITNFPGLLQLLFTPQGVEFARNTQYPSLKIWREFKALLPPEGYCVDAGEITLENPSRVVLTGNTHARIRYTTPDQRCELLVFEGATAQVEVSGYGVVFWADCGAKEVKITTTERGLAYEL